MTTKTLNKELIKDNPIYKNIGQEKYKNDDKNLGK